MLQVIQLSKKYVKMHQQYSPVIYDLMKRATKEPIMVNAPLWWIDPTDRTALTIDSGKKNYKMDDLLHRLLELYIHKEHFHSNFINFGSLFH